MSIPSVDAGPADHDRIGQEDRGWRFLDPCPDESNAGAGGRKADRRRVSRTVDDQGAVSGVDQDVAG